MENRASARSLGAMEVSRSWELIAMRTLGIYSVRITVTMTVPDRAEVVITSTAKVSSLARDSIELARQTRITGFPESRSDHQEARIGRASVMRAGNAIDRLLSAQS